MLDAIDIEIKKTAEKAVIQELNERGVDYRTIKDEDFAELVQIKIDKLKTSVEKVGLTAAIAAALAVFTGGI